MKPLKCMFKTKGIDIECFGFLVRYYMKDKYKKMNT